MFGWAFQDAGGSMGGLRVERQGGISFANSTSAYQLDLGAGGITLAGSGNITFWQNATLNVIASQAWTNNTSTPFTFNNAVSAAVVLGNDSLAPVALTLAGTGNFNFGEKSKIVSNNPSVANGVLIDTTGTVVFGSTNNSYTGATTIQRGVLQLTNKDAIATSAMIFIDENGTLDVATIADFVIPKGQTLAGSGTIKGDNITINGTLESGSALTFLGKGVQLNDMELDYDIDAGMLDITGDFSVNTITVNLLNIANGKYELIHASSEIAGWIVDISGTISDGDIRCDEPGNINFGFGWRTLKGNNITFSIVKDGSGIFLNIDGIRNGSGTPEPASLAVLGLGAAALMVRRRK